MKHSLRFQAADGRRVSVDVSPRGSYRPAAEDRLGVFREPREGEWQVYVNPATIDLRQYHEMVKCLDSNSTDEKSAEPLPVIATIRYANLHLLRRRYECEAGGRLDLHEDGLVYFQSDSSVLLGSIIEGDTFAMDASVLSYLSSRGSGPIPSPLSYIQRCSDHSGSTMFDEFEVSVLPGATFWQKLQDQRDDVRRVYRNLASAVRSSSMSATSLQTIE